MKGKVKKNQLIIVALAVMIAAAGYLNWRGGSNKWFSPDYGSPGKSYKRTGACPE